MTVLLADEQEPRKRQLQANVTGADKAMDEYVTGADTATGECDSC